MNESRKNFDAEAGTWDEDPGKVKLAGEVAQAIIRTARPGQDMDVLDFGCGTGLVALHLAPLVRSLTGVDSSPGMLTVFRAKAEAQGRANVTASLVDLEEGGELPGGFDLVVCSMTLHHVRDVPGLIRKLGAAARPGGQLCLADLDPEQGRFHSDNVGVFHFGLERDLVARAMAEAGFQDIGQETAAQVEKTGPQGVQSFSVFLLSGRKQA